MKYKYHKGSEADFDGHPGAILVVKSASTGMVYHLGLNYAGRDKDIEKVGDIIIAHREPEPDPWMLFESPTEALITERGSRYGKFKDGAEIMQSLKDTMRDVDGRNNLTASQKEALDMIQHKIGRILNGDPTYDDSWKDIAGYATLIVNELNGEVK
nr:MAG: nucleotide modification associated domain 1 [Bacteriophage sp.]